MNRSVCFTLTIVLCYFFISCSNGNKKSVSDPAAYTEYISAYTSGVIRINDDIRIDLNSISKEVNPEQLPSDLFQLDPSVPGKTILSNGHTLIFHPDKPLRSGENYDVTFNLGLVLAVPEALKQFAFRIKTIDADYSIEPVGIRSFRTNGKVELEITGSLITSDLFPSEKVEKIIQCEQDGSELPVRWEHSGNGTLHQFVILDVKRTENPGKVSMSWNGDPIESDRKGNQDVVIPATGDFSLLGSTVISGTSPYIELSFSDPLDPDQETEGLFMMQNIDFEVSVDDNRIKLIPRQEVIGEQKLEIFSGLKNYAGVQLGINEVVSLSLQPEKPAIRFIGKGNIVPETDGLVVPFEAVNLSAVGIRIVKIFSGNYHQFFQVNNLDEYNSLKNVGRPVYRGVLPLSGIHAVVLNKWSAYSLKINDLIKVEPGAIYQVQLSMRPEFSLYPCSEDAQIKSVKRKSETADDEKWLTESYIDEDERWNEYEGNRYDWQNRNNPCYLSYFIENRNTTKNVIASNIGLLAKRGMDNQLLVVATNLLNAQPQKGTEITVFDYQAQIITNGQTGDDGMLLLTLDRTPFLIVAKSGNDVGYLKISDEASLQLSRFDVGGDEVQKGLKGFLYGERGVWRPGDSLFVSLIIQDKIHKLAPDHPVIFELYTPTDQLNQKIVLPLKGNITTFKTVTKADSPTGNWRLVARVGGAEFSKRIRIETVKPNRLKILFTTSAEQLQAGTETQTASLNAKWLQGSPAGSLKAKVEMVLKKGKTVFPKFMNYSFDNQIVKFESADRTVFDGQLNEKGDVSFPLNLGALSNAPGKLEAVFTTRVFESGGDFSISQFSKPVSPFGKYVGIRFPDEDPARSMLSSGKVNEMELVVVNPDGNLTESPIEILAYKIDWRWWWDASDDYLGNYVTQEQYKPFLTRKLTTSGGKAILKFNVPNEEWGRYLFIAKLPDGHSVSQTVYLDWPYGSASSQQSGGATMLSFSADKEKYKVGEPISVSFPSSADGKALVTIENGSSVLDKFWIDTKAGQTQVSFKAKPEMAPNIYLYITYLQPHGQTVNDRPIRLYGVISVNVENPETHLIPEIKAPEELRSQQPFTVEVSEKNGVPMNYTLAIVDEGLLDLTGYKTPDPWNIFFAREALGVKTWDLYDYVLGAYGGTLEKLFAVGGSDQLPDPSKQKAQRFKPVVRFLGPFKLGQNGKQKHTLILPQYTGSVRFMVVAASNNAFGSAEEAVPVRDPLMILATVPRVIGINELIELPVSVFAQKSSIKNVEVSVSLNSLLSLNGNTKLTVPFAEVGEKDVHFSLRSGMTTGKAVIEVTARSGNEKAVYSVEVDVRNPNPMIVTSQTDLIKASQSREFSLQEIGAPGTGSTTVEISSSPPMNLGKRLDYLINYPHGCIEQAVSAAFSQLFISQFVNLDSGRKAKTESNIRAGLDQLRKFQLADGSFTYWPGSKYPSLWGTSWAGNFMIEAEALGFVIPGELKKRWISYQKNAANAWRKELTDRGMILDQAYRLYTLALANTPAIGAMNRLRETPNLPLAARWKLAAAYVLASRPEVAEQLVDMTRLEPSEYQNEGVTFGSSLRDRAILLETLTLMKKKTFAYPVAKDISAALCSDQWMSTQTTANCLLAMSRFTGKNNNPDEKLKFKLTVNGKSEELSSDKTTFTRELPAFDGKLPVKISSLTGSDLYVTIVQKGIPLHVDIPARQNGLKLDVAYVASDGKPLDIANIPKGSDFTVVVRVKNTGFTEVDNLALTQVFPSGWEIINERLFGGETGSSFDYRDIRDDRVLTYFNLKLNEQKEFKVKLNASYSGSYFLPPVQCEAMYNNVVSANNSGMKVVVGK
ncbi:MAG TPA: alpha-2-macroglobulin family protein [Prolixibacteraceae bacterium]|nr:alpha-2-macroglobulin family protein [Prolixibacteraceae bacterium]